MLLSELGQRIRFRRERLGLKQLDIANALQVSPQAVSKWERGENSPDVAILGALSKLLGVSIDWLLDADRHGLDEFDATVFTSTVLGAYAKSLRMQAGEFAVWANGLLFPLTEAVLRYDGIPIKYMGDAFLCFFSGVEHQRRAVKAADLATRLMTEELVIGLHSGEIYLGAMGHPDYAHRDITGEAVNIAFLIRNWAEAHMRGGIAATTPVASQAGERCAVARTTAVMLQGLDEPIDIHELCLT